MKAPVHRPRRSHKLLFGLFAFSAALVLLAITSARVFADGVQIVDNAHVLDAAQVMEQASQLPDPVDIYTTSTFTGTTQAFDTFTATMIGPNDSELIVLNIDVAHRYLAIADGTDVSLTGDQYAAAIQAFNDSFSTNGADDYTDAAIAALQSLNNVFDESPPAPFNNGYPPNGQVDPGQMQMFPNGSLETSPDVSPALSFILFVAIVVGAVFVIKTVASAASRGPRRSTAQPLDARPFEAGALGTMVGYEPGREEMEHQQQEQIQLQMFNNPPPPPPPTPINNFPGGNIGGGAGGNF